MQTRLTFDEAQAPPGALSPGIRRAVEHIEENFADPVRLAELAVIAGLSLHRFVTVFRIQLGVPPHRYMCRVRVREARMLLRRGLPLATVAVETGFFDQSHLSRHFKRQCGMTPGFFAATPHDTNERSPSCA